jgi:hypothetical protein
MTEHPRRFGTSDELFDRDAFLKEHGCLLLLRRLDPIDGEEVFEDVPAQFRAEDGSPAASLRLGQDLYVFSLEDMEAALSDPAPEAPDDEAFPSPELGTREACQEARGCVLLMRAAEEIEDEELYEPVPAKFVKDRILGCSLRVRGDYYLVRPDDLWDALTDPSTYKADDEGPVPIDVLRDPPTPDDGS